MIHVRNKNKEKDDLKMMEYRNRFLEKIIMDTVYVKQKEGEFVHYDVDGDVALITTDTTIAATIEPNTLKKYYKKEYAENYSAYYSFWELVRIYVRHSLKTMYDLELLAEVLKEYPNLVFMAHGHFLEKFIQFSDREHKTDLETFIDYCNEVVNIQDLANSFFINFDTKEYADDIEILAEYYHINTEQDEHCLLEEVAFKTLHNILEMYFINKD